MRPTSCTALAVITLLFCMTPFRVVADDDAKAASILAELGRDTFQQYCMSCHGVKGEGDGPVAKVLRTAPADLTIIAKRRAGVFPEEEIVKFIDGRTDVAAHGTRDMPIWGRRFGQPIAEDTTGDEVVRGQLLLLLEYLKSIQKIQK